MRPLDKSLILGALLAAGCKNDSGLARVVDPGTGDLVVIEGRVCDPERGTWLEGATVYMHLFTEDGTHYDTKMDETDATGSFQLTDIPVNGLQPIYVQYGNEVIDQFQVNVPEGATYVTLPDPDCGGGEAAFAVVSGDYDDFAATLQELGFGDFDLINGLTGDELVQFLSSEAGLNGYDAIFFGGGHLEEDVIYDSDGSGSTKQVEAVKAAVRAYVEGGGIIVATDWSYDLIEAIWPEKVEFLGEDTIPDDAQRGETGTVNANVADSAMATAIGTSEVEISLDLIEWPLIESADPSTTVHLLADVRYRSGEVTQDLAASPLLVSFQAGSGTVWFSSFRFGANTETTGKKVVRNLLDSL